ncbi:MAG: peptidoglycan DD-metalloendopeptidase family protein [Clostridiales bacterium]|nr:peptidoglycan DD-metalloendopeptidase family protein [Clostridiales bacterium]
MTGKRERRSGKKTCRFPIKAVVALALVASLAMTPALVWNTAPTSAASSITDLKNKQSDIQKKQKETAAQLEKLKADQSQQQAYKEALDTQLANVQEEVRVITERVNLLDSQIKQKESEIADQQTKIDGQFDELKEYIKAMYLTGEASNLEILLNAENILDFSEKLQVVQSISSYEAQLIDNLQAALAEIADEKKAIEENRTEVAQAKKELETKQAQVESLVAESQKVLEQLKSQVNEQNKVAQDLAAQKAATDKEIDAWYAEYYRKQEEERKRREEEARRQQQQNGGGSSGSSNNNSTPQVSGTGQLTWPCPGVTKITSYWGDGRNHQALDIAGAGAYGKAIVASDSGTVIRTNTSGWGGGYGQYVMVDHGNGISTMYAHCSSVVVSPGQTVRKGQTIAYIGSTGDSSGPHLHFEVRVNGVKKNPLNYL